MVQIKDFNLVNLRSRLLNGIFDQFTIDIMHIQQDRAPNFCDGTKKDGWEFIQNEGGGEEREVCNLDNQGLQ